MYVLTIIINMTVKVLALNLTVTRGSLNSDTQMFIFHLHYIKPEEVEQLKPQILANN